MRRVPHLDLHPRTVGIALPADEILKRTKYNWLTNISTKDLLESNIIIAKYFKASIQDTTNEYYKTPTERSVVSI